jgi:hypothetical protein
VIFEEFAPSTGDSLARLRALRGRVLTLITASGGICALVQVAFLL